MGVLASITVGARAFTLASLLLVEAASATARADCKPAAITQGDPALVKTVSTRLSASGISTTAAAGCPSVQVRLEKRGDQVHLQVTDAYKRFSERDVQDAATAAAIIESWTLQEVEAGALPEAPAIATAAIPPAIAVRHLVRHGVSASLMSAVGSDRTTWVGGSLAACLRVGPTCVGASLRGESDTGATGPTSTLAQSSYVLSALATIDLPRKLGGFVLTPGIGVGYGWLHVTTTHHDAMNNPFDIPSADHQLRTGAHVALVRAVSDHLSMFGDMWGDIALARSDSQFGPGSALRLSLGIRLEAL